MRILFFSQYFPPEVGATQTRAFEMARRMVVAGHEVTVITEVPNHPSGIVANEFRSQKWVRREYQGIDVLHMWVKASPVKTLQSRLLFYLSYMLTAIFGGLFLARGKYDVIYSTSPPLFAGVAALTVSIIRRIPMVFEVRDLWPESAVALGELQNRNAIAIMSFLANRCYAHSKSIIAVTRGIEKELRRKEIPNGKIHFVPNGANSELFQHREEGARRVRTELDLQDNFIVVYAGLIGLAYSLETVIDAAKLLQERPNIQFLIIGAGPRETEVRSYAAEQSVHNVRFLGQKKYEELPDYLSAADVAVIPLRKLDFFNGTLPVKMFDAWACQCPTILAVNGGEAEAVLAKAEAGVSIEPENATALVEAIIALRSAGGERKKMGQSGRDFVTVHFSREIQAQRVMKVLDEAR